MRRTLIGLGASALAFACAGKTLDVGSRSGSANPGAGAGGTAGMSGSGGQPAYPLPSFPGPEACVTGEELPIVGTWDGHVEGSAVGTPRDSFRVTINGASEEGGVCGTVVYGEGTPPPPATDPDTGYPSVEGYGTDVYGLGGGPAVWGPLPGFPYTMMNGIVNASRVRFGTAWSELWKSWCELQTPVDGYCLPNMGGRFGSDGCVLIDPQTRAETSVDCGKAQLCLLGPVCECNATECVASTGTSVSGSSGFDFQFDGDSADGSVNGRGRARLFRVE